MMKTNGLVDCLEENVMLMKKEHSLISIARENMRYLACISLMAKLVGEELLIKLYKRNATFMTQLNLPECIVFAIQMIVIAIPDAIVASVC